ncbi:MAG: hypothetical protein MUF29_05775 [Chitinophagaceae bacterium]|jgi:hypothetical protein|nr:hypothetical protein [Chitinophagaceae bacterium]
MTVNISIRTLIPILLLLSCLSLASGASAQPSSKPYTEEYYYKVKWGYQEEFLALFRKYHYPILKKQMELGRILSVRVESPQIHFTEEGRWDYRVTVVWKDQLTPFDDFDGKALIRQLYPDQETFKKEEQRRFELLLAHWDLPVSSIKMD